MAEIYVYEADATDLGSIGLCGCLTPTSCEFEDVANGLSAITLEHPFDEWGKFRFLQPDRILSVEVPVRNTTEIENGHFVTNVETWTVLPTASQSERTIYNSKDGDKKLKVVKINETVTVVKAPVYADRYKVKYKKWSGWMPKVGLQKTSETTIPDDVSGIERVAPSWTIKPQYFRIESVDISESGGVVVHAKHIFYDLLFNLTDYKTADAYTLQAALDGMLTQTVSEHDFTAQTNIQGTHTGFSAKDLDPVTATLDPDTGLCSEWDAELVRDNYDFFLLDRAGFDRGTTIEYAKNLAGVSMTTDITQLCTSIRPVGETKDGKPLYLSENNYPDGCINSPLIDNYAFRRTMRLVVNEAKVDDEDITTADARRMMKDAVDKQFDEYGVDKPTVQTIIDFASLGDDERYTQYKELDKVYLFDTVSVRHEELGITVASQVVRIVYDCLHETLVTVELGALQQLMPSIAGWQLAGGIPGYKLIDGTIPGGKFGDDVISARHIQAQSINADKIQANAITANKIAANAITAEKITANAITAEKIAAGAITAEKIAANAITAEKIAAGAITADKIDANAITANKIAAGAITAEKIAANAITAEKIAAGVITAGKIAAGTITANEIAAGAITATEIAAGAITSVKIDAGAVTTGKLDAGAVTAAKIAAGAITADKIAAGAITASHIASKTITADQLKAGLITADSGLIATSAIGTAQIADGSITSAKIVSLNADVITAGTLSVERLLLKGDNGLFYKMNVDAGGMSAQQLSDAAYKNAISGTAIVANSITAAKIAAGTITANEIAANTITAAKIASGTITATQIASGTITGAKIASSTIEAGNIAANAITTAKLNAEAVTAAKIAADAITAEKIVANAVTADKINAGAVTTIKLAANAVTAAKVDVADLFAAQATINAINAMDIRSNTYLQMMVKGAVNLASIKQQRWAVSAGGTMSHDIYENSIAYAYSMSKKIFRFSGTWTGDYTILAFDNCVLKASTAYTLTYYTRVDGVTGGYPTLRIDVWNSDNQQYLDNGGYTYTSAMSNYARHTWHFTCNTSGTYSLRFLFFNSQRNGWNGGRINISDVMFCEGWQVTPWTPSTYEMADRMDAAEILITDSHIIQTVTSSQEYADDLALAKQGAIDVSSEEIALRVGEISIGGANLVRYADSTVSVGTGSIYSPAPDTYYRHGGKEFRLYPFTSGSYNYVQFLSAAPMWAGVSYTISFIAWAYQVTSTIPTLSVSVLGTDTNNGNINIARTATLTAAPKKFEYTFTPTQTASNAGVRFLFSIANTFTGTFIGITDVKFEEGNKATAWNPHREELRAGSSVTITENEVAIATPSFSIDIGSDGSKDVLIDETGAAFKTLNVPNMAQIYTGPTAITVSAASGNSLRTVFEELNNKILLENVTITLAENDTSSGSIYLHGVGGTGQITITGAISGGSSVYGAGGRVVIRPITVWSCSVRVMFEDITFNYQGGTILTGTTDAFLRCTRCLFNGGNGSSTLVEFHNGTNAMLYSCLLTSNNGATLMQANYNVDLLIYGCKGGSSGNFISTNGANVKVYSSRPFGNWARAAASITAPSDITTVTVNNIGYSGGGSSPIDPPAADPTTTTFNTTAKAGYGTGAGWSTTATRHGIFDGTNYVGGLWFNLSSIPSTATVRAASVTLTRNAAGPDSSNVRLKTINRTASNYSSVNPNNDSYKINDYGKIGVTRRQKAVEINLPVSAINDIKAYNYGLLLYCNDSTQMSGKSYSDNYASYSGATLSVTYV